MQRPRNNRGLRPLIFRLAGLLALAAAILGILLPLLPTTPFLLLSAYCFGRGSDRLQRWLLEHPRLGPPIRDWRERGAISRKVKGMVAVATVLVIVASMAMGAPPVLLVVQGVVLALVGAFVFTRPSR